MLRDSIFTDATVYKDGRKLLKLLPQGPRDFDVNLGKTEPPLRAQSMD